MIRELHHSFQNLNQSLVLLKDELLKQQPKHWLPLTEQEQSSSNSLAVLTALISDLWYQNQDQDGRKTRARHGLVLINETVAQQIKEVNALKDDFKLAVQKTRKHLKDHQLREAMLHSELSRVHLRQCYRHLPLIKEWPSKVGFSWYVSGRSIRKLNISQVEKMLLELGEEKLHIQQQLNKLYLLPEQTVLAQVQTLAPVVRANLVFSESKKAMNAPLPLFILDQGLGLPEFNEVSLTPPEARTRKARADQKIEPEPYLPSLRVHLYRA